MIETGEAEGGLGAGVGRDQGDADVRRISIKEIARRTGLARNTVRAALRSCEPPGYGPRPKRASKLDPFVWKSCELLEDEPALSGVRVLEEISALGYSGGKTILDDLLRGAAPALSAAAEELPAHCVSPG